MSGGSEGRSLPLSKVRSRFLIPTLPLVFGFVILVSVAAGLWSIASKQESHAGPAPHELAGYELAGVMVGPEALAEINSLHGKPVGDISDGWVAHYDGNATIWVATAATDEDARRLLDEMALGIQNGDSPFRGLAAQTYEGLTLYRVTDGQQWHFFYQRGLKVVWIAAPRGAEDEFLAAAFGEVG